MAELTITAERPTHADVVHRAERLVDLIREQAASAEENHALSPEIVEDFIEAGFTRILAPRSYGGYELGLHTWFDVVKVISSADAAHGWSASLMIHHSHYLAAFPTAAQEAVWADGPDVAISGPAMPTCTITRVDGGYRVSGHSPFASGVLHSSWVFVGGFLPDPGPPEWAWFLIRPGDYRVEDTWDTVAMRATGSNTVITDDVFVPEEHSLKVADLREGTSDGAALHESDYFRAPWVSYAAITFLAVMLGATEGAFQSFHEATAKRMGPGGQPVAETPSLQLRLARVASDLDSVELLLRRAVDVASTPERATLELRARSNRDFARSSEILVTAINELMSMSGTSGFATTNPVQRAWRDVNLASRHISLSPDGAYTLWTRQSFGFDRDPRQPIY